MTTTESIDARREAGTASSTTNGAPLLHRLGPGKTAPYWIELLPELPGRRSALAVEVRPLTPAVRSAAQIYAQAQIEALEGGGPPETDIGPLSDPNVRMAIWRQHYVVGLGLYGIIGWRGVGDDNGNPVERPWPAGIEGLLANDVVFELFHARYTGWLEDLEQAKNASRPAPNGTSASGRNTAKAAGKPRRRAPKARQG